MAESNTQIAKKESGTLEKEQTFSGYLTENLERVSDCLPKDFNKARFVQNTISLLNDNPQLAKYGKQQLLGGLLKGATLGLDFFNRECYLIPYGNQLNYQTDYRGAKKLAKKYSIRPIKDIYAKLVREGDDFQERVANGEQTIYFSPLPFNDGEIIGAFAVCQFQDGGLIYDTMSRAELENTRKSSKAPNSPAWENFTGEMYKKTVLHRLCKHIELDFESPEQRSAFTAGMEIETDTEKIVEAEISENANKVEFDAEFEEVPNTEEQPLPDFMAAE